MSLPSILVVEDNKTLRRLLEYRLSKRFHVRTAENGEAALLLVEETVPDAIVSDIMMPVMDGFALLSALRSEPATETIPFIFLTAKTDDLSRDRGLKKGVDDYLTKPFDVDHLIQRLDLLVRRSRASQEKLSRGIARDFSDSLLPREMPVEPGYRSIFFTKPKDDGGGDLFDWTRTPDGAYLITVGDIMGKGLKAKFYAYSFLAFIRSTIHAMLRTTVSPAALMSRVNEVLITDPALEETFASLLLLRWEPDTGRVVYANAGHCRPIVAAPAGPGVVDYSDLILGLDIGTEYTDHAFTLEPGAALVCYTDALSEQVTRAGAMFGESGVALAAQAALDAPQPIHTMLSWLLRRSEQPRFDDDVLAFWLKREA